MRLIPLLLSLVLTSLSAAPAVGPALFSSEEVLEMKLEFPIADLIANARKDSEYLVKGAVSYLDPASGQQVLIKDVEVSTRGHTSLPRPRGRASTRRTG